MKFRLLLNAALCACALGGAGPAAAAALSVGDALERPAVAVPQPGRGAVLLAAAQAGPRLVAVGERGIVLLSDDAGASWRQAQVPVSVTLTAVRFADARQGWAVGHAGVVLATSDAGQTWTRQLDGKAAAALMLQAARAGGEPEAVKEAERMVADGADKPLLDLHFFDAQRGLVVGAYNLAFATGDGGKSWKFFGQLLDNRKAQHLYAVRAQGDTLLIAGEQGLVLLSSDGGRSFKRIATPYKGTFFSAELPSARDIVLAGLRGNVWRSTDGGAAWTAVASPAPVSFTASARVNAQEVVLANQGGGLFSLKDGSLKPLGGPALPPVGGLLPLADGRLLALTVRGPILVPSGGAVK